MSMWDAQAMTDKVRRILRDGQFDEPDQLGQPYFSPYQIAIALDEDTRRALGKPIGGAGGGGNSLAKYIAGELASRIRTGEITDIEGAWLSSANTHVVSFKHEGDIITASGGKDAVISMFRLREA